MGDPNKKPRLGSMLVGLLVMAAGVTAIFVFKGDKQPEEEPTLVRPLKTIVVGTPFEASEIGRAHV